MNDEFFRKMLNLLFAALAVVLVLASVCHAEDSSVKSVSVSTDDMREIVTYVTALEREAITLKTSLASEREETEKMIADFEAERKATAEYTKTLESVNQSNAAEIKRLNRRSATKNYILAVLTAAIVTLAVTH